jgi:hypothetical protein
MNPDGVFIDSGAGAGIIDRLREMGYKVFEVIFGSTPDDEQYADKRTELWGRMRDWLIGGTIDNHDKLKKDLCQPEYEYTGKGQDKIKLESKDHMRKKRCLPSTDHGDALAMTFFANIAHRDTTLARKSGHRPQRAIDNYKPFGS